MEKSFKEKSITEKLGFLMPIITAALIVITGIVFTVAVLHLYFTGGDTPYTRVRVGEYLRTIIVPIILTVVSVVAAAVISILYGAQKKKSAKSDSETTYKILARIFDERKAPEDFRKKISGERKKRRRLLISACVFCAVLLTVSFVLSVVIPGHEIDGLNSHVLSAFIIITPASVISIAAIYATLLYFTTSYERELSAMKAVISALPEAKKLPTPDPVLQKREKRLLLAVRLGALTLGVLFVVLGVFNGGAHDVFAKAVAICTECIGLG